MRYFTVYPKRVNVYCNTIICCWPTGFFGLLVSSLSNQYVIRISSKLYAAILGNQSANCVPISSPSCDSLVLSSIFEKKSFVAAKFSAVKLHRYTRKKGIPGHRQSCAILTHSNIVQVLTNLTHLFYPPVSFC